jgi:hypothetical protein
MTEAGRRCCHCRPTARHPQPIIFDSHDMSSGAAHVRQYKSVFNLPMPTGN